MITEFIFDCGDKFLSFIKQELERTNPRNDNPGIYLRLKHGEPYLTGEYSFKRIKGSVLNIDPKMGGMFKKTVEHWSCTILPEIWGFLGTHDVEKFILKRHKDGRIITWTTQFFDSSGEIDVSNPFVLIRYKN